jgi:hypothetical protein
MSATKVDKPWGYELRFVRTDRYAGKVLFIKAGRSSASSTTKERRGVLRPERHARPGLGQRQGAEAIRMTRGLAPHPPGTVHRFRAVTDTLLFEVRHPELEDVVRIEDDYGREGVKDVL